MKKVISIFLNLFFSIASLNSLSAQKLNFNFYNELGEYHNSFLEHILTSKQLKNIEKINSYQLNEMLVNFASKSKYFAELKNECYSSISTFTKLAYENELFNVKKSSSITDDFIEKNLPKNCSIFFQVILHPELKNDINEYRNDLMKIKDEVISSKQLSEFEKDLTLFAVAIGINSSNFWEKRTDEWMTYSNTTKKLPKDFWKNFIKEDVKGGVVGALVTATAASVVVPVIGAIPGWVVGAVQGAICNSVAWGIAELLWP